MIDDLPARFAHTAAAAEALEAVVGGVDPLYRPAEFLLGYTYLKRGDAENAERIFARLVGRIEDQQRQVINAARERWLRGSRWLPFARRIPLVREWIAYYADVVCDLFGGPWVRAAEAWAELSEREPSDAESRNLPAQISQTTREINVDMIALVVGDAARIAWGMRTSETLSQADARAFLEPYFDREEIQTFNADARMLGALSLSRDVERASASIRGTAVPAWSEGYGRLAKLRANRLAFWYKHSLGELDAQLKDEAAGGEHALDRVRQIARKLERATQEPRRYLFVGVLENPKIDSWPARIASIFIPALTYVRKNRQRLREPLYVESVFCLAQALLMNNELASLKRASQRARQLRESRLAPNSGERQDDLSILTVCLEVEAWARVAELQLKPPDGSKESREFKTTFEFEQLESRWKTHLERVAKNESHRRDARAAANVALGLFERRKRRELAARQGDFRSQRDEEQFAQARYDEVDRYRQALALQPAANAHCYTAECLLEPERQRRYYAASGISVDIAEADILRMEAQAHVREALRLVPNDVLARRLLREITTPPA